MEINVLIVDDSEDDALLIAMNLKQHGYIVNYERVDTSDGLKSALKRGGWEVILIDYSMPHFSGMSAMARIRQQNTDIPCIVISGNIREDIAVDMMRGGANDYVMKDNMARLVPAIEQELAQAEVRRQKRQADLTIVRQRDFLSTIIDSLDHPFYVIDANDYTVKIANKAVKESNTWKDRITCYALMHNRQSPCDIEQCPCPLIEVVSTGQSAIVEHTHYDNDSKECNIEVHAHPIFDSEGNVVQIIKYCLDITERKQAEEKLLNKQKQLQALSAQLSSSEEQERRRIAEGLHDDIIQPLAFLDINLKSLLDSDSDSELTVSYQKMRTIIKKLINDVRDFTFELSYPVLHELGLEKAIRQWVEAEIQEKQGLTVELLTDSRQILIKDDMQIFLFKAVKELLVNVVKHAQASKVKISLAQDQDSLVICVEDDGVGLPVGVNSNKEKIHFGLLNIHNRINYLGGCFEITSEHSTGTRAVITMPLEKGIHLKGTTV